MGLNDDVALFCKANSTMRTPVQTLFHAYRKNTSFISCTQFEFEKSLRDLNKKVIQAIETKCLYCMRKPGYSYKKFIKEHQYITEDFWDLIKRNAQDNGDLNLAEVKKKPPKKPFEIKDDLQDYMKYLPVNWNEMSLSERIDMVGKVKHKGFKEYVLKLDPQVNLYMKNSKITHNEKKMSLYVTLFSFPSDTTSEEAKALLKGFVDSLNLMGRARLQYMECTEPPVVEIREVRS